MHVKKLLATTLAGLVLVGGLSGCSRTIIEHQFHNTGSNTSASVSDSQTSLALQKLIALFDKYNIIWQLQSQTRDINDTTQGDLMVLINALPDKVESDAVENFVNPVGDTSAIIAYKKCTDSSDLFQGLLTLVDETYEYLSDSKYSDFLAEESDRSAMLLQIVYLTDQTDPENNYVIFQLSRV